MTEGEQEWIEAPDGWGEEEEGSGEGCGLDLFADNDPHEMFEFEVKSLTSSSTKKLKLAGFKLDSDESDQSTGVTMWQAAPRLANYLQEDAQELVAGRTVLELGAGLGLCGMVAHHLGAQSVVLTDGDTKTLKNLRENVLKNFGATEAIDCRQLLWGSPHMEKFKSAHGTFDVILGADVIYTQSSTGPLFDTVACLLEKPNGRFVLSRYKMWNNVSDEVVLEAAKARNLECTQPAEGIYVFHWNDSKRGDEK